MMSYVPAILTRSAVAALVACSFAPAHAQSAADFYRGKNVAVAIASVPAAATTSMPARWRATWASTSRAIRRWCRRTCPAPADLRVAQFYSQAAPKDGLTFGTFTRMAGIAPLFDPTQNYDARS